MSIDRKNPMTHGLIAAVEYSRGYPYEHVNNMVGTNNNGAEIVLTEIGLVGQYLNANCSHSFELTEDHYAGSSAITMLAIFKSLGETDSAAKEMCMLGKTGGAVWTAKLMKYDYNVPTGAYFAGIQTEATAHYSTINAEDCPWYTGFNVYANFWGSNKRQAAINTNITNTVTLGTSPLKTWSDPDVKLYVGRGGSSGSECDGQVALVAIWNRRLGRAEYLKFLANPWQIFDDRRQDLTSVLANLTVEGLLEITLVDTQGNPLPNLSGLSWAWFDDGTVDTLTSPVLSGSGETTDANGLFSINIGGSGGTALSTGQTGILMIMDSTGYIYALYRVVVQI